MGRPARGAAGVAQAERRPVLRARPPDRPAPRHAVPQPVPVRAGHEVGTTADATFLTAPRGIAESFTFTAFADEGIPGPSLDRDPSLLPESDWEEWNNGSYDPDDPDRPARTHRNTTKTVITQVTKVRNLINGTPARFNLLAGDL
jgi:hypothetical protein